MARCNSPRRNYILSRIQPHTVLCCEAVGTLSRWAGMEDGWYNARAVQTTQNSHPIIAFILTIIQRKVHGTFFLSNFEDLNRSFDFIIKCLDYILHCLRGE